MEVRDTKSLDFTTKTLKSMKKIISFATMLSLYSVCGILLQAILLNVLLANPNHAQDTRSFKEIYLEIETKNAGLTEVFQVIESGTDFVFSYDRRDVDKSIKFSFQGTARSLADILTEISVKTSLQFKRINNDIDVKKMKGRESEKVIEYLQPINVTGKVSTLSEGGALPGVNILVKGKGMGTITDVDGNYSLNVPDQNDTLLVSSIGYMTEEIPIRGRSIIDITLSEDIQSLSEVVVVGYGTQKRSDLTGSVASVSSETLEKLQLTTVEDGLRGNAAGVRVIQTSGAPGADVTVRIRGNNSIQGNNSPLYVVDGLPIQGGLNNLNPNSIKSIEVLKDASATAIYGARAANGVVIVTTKNGVRGESRFDISANTGIEYVSKYLDVLSGVEYATLANEAAINDGRDMPFDLNNLTNAETDWQDLIYSAGVRKNYSVAFSGGGENSTYSINGDILDIDGVVEGTGFERQSVQLNFTQNAKDWLKIENHYNLSHTKSNNTEGGRPGQIGDNSRNTSITSALAAPPLISPFDADENYSSLNPFPFIEQILHPLALIRERVDLDDSYNFFGSTGANFTLTEGLKFELKGGVNYSDTRSDDFRSNNLNPASNNSGSIQTRRSFYWLFQNTLNYDKQINEENRISAVVGFTAEEQEDKTLFAFGSGFPNENITNQSLQSAAFPGIPQSFVSKFGLLSYLGRINYSLMDRYLFTATGRYDGSSRLGPDNKYGFFPSFAIGWKLSEENFIDNLDIFSTLKLRGSWGLTGNTNISPYQSLSVFSVTQAFIDGPTNLAVGFAPSNVANPELKWEETSQFDIGLDFGFFDDKLDFTIDYYDKTTNGLLAFVNLPQSSGFTSVIRNVGKVKNSGVEVQLNGTLIDKPDLFLSSVLTFASNNNEVIETANQDPIFGSGQSVFPPITVSREGDPISSFWGLVRSDLLTEDGREQFEDINNDGEITAADNTIIGNPHPEFIYSLSPSLEYKNFTLDLLLEGTQGNDIFNVSKMELNDTFNKGGNMTAEVLDRWSPTNLDRTARYPRMGTSTFPSPSDQFIEDGSYLRFKQLTIGYNLDADRLNWNFVKSARIYARAVNLFTITNYSWYDPEVNTFGNSGLNLGIERNSYPQVRTFSLGVNVSL